MITTIIFDIGEVCLRGVRGLEHKLEPTLKLAPAEIHRQLHIPQLQEFFHGEITEEQYWEALLSSTGWPFTLDQLKAFIRENFGQIEGTREIIEELKAKGYKLGLLSVHAKEWVEYCNAAFDYHRLFHSTLYSFEVRISKPDKRAYEFIVKKLNAKPQECLFIDDQHKNLIPAQELGLLTIEFKNAGQLRKELVSLSLL
jgi:HAD superfamily hydrolase (TIGR01509 family)